MLGAVAHTLISGSSHPQVITEFVEKPVAQGGLGLTRLQLNYCKLDANGVNKPTIIWTNVEPLIKALKDGDFRCTSSNPCEQRRLDPNGRHAKQVSGRDGRKGLSQQDAAAYPPLVANFFAQKISAGLNLLN